MQDIANWFSHVYQALVTYLYSLLLTLYDALQDLLFAFLLLLMDLALLLLHALDSLVGVLASYDFVSLLPLIPPEVKAVMAALGFSTALSIRVTSLTIRFILQTIPFVRWGS